MLLLQVMHARRWEQPGGAKRGAAVGWTDLWGHGWSNACPMGNGKGTMRTPNPTEAGPWQENPVFQRGGPAPSPCWRVPSRAGLEQNPFPPRGATQAPSPPPRRGLVVPPHRQAEGRSQYLRHPEPWLLGTQTGCIWGARHSQRPPVLPERRMLRPLPVESCQA